MAEAGLGLSSKSSGKTGYSEKGGAESGALACDSGAFDPDLAVVVKAWPDLPESVRRDILAMVEGAR